ncbi:cytochrome P450 family protein [Streptomyces antimicrobicus]|uniref:Cytochrome P450 n=1 Tax=Streptomyces antimicrobicus TaxID=2883108 RepID=A0ABS8B4E0_9ACTN|nr:cytochrome P450 [Streptomyces antimicrobicus]MCB5179454.1 cytochrome P450 [Streptomyces antimicrobicus]
MADLDVGGHAEGFTADPYPYYAELREAGPVHRVALDNGDLVWLVVGHEACREALNHPALSKNWQDSVYFGDVVASAVNHHMLESDPPRHTRLRRLVAREFTGRRVEAMRPRVQEITDGLLDAMAADGARRADLIRSLAFPLPMTVICELLGVPDLDREQFRRWSNEVVAPSSPAASSWALAEVAHYLGELIEDKRCSPGEDLMSALIRTRDEGGDRLSHEELVSMAFLLLVAGHETTVNLIGNGVRALLDHPDQLAALRADPDLLDGAVEEMLRYDGPVENSTFRFAREDTVVAGVPVPAGDAVLVSLAGADRDPSRFPAPDTFDIRRAPQGHLAFGHGIHFCLGAPLARLEGRIAVRSLLERFPGLARDPEGEEPEWITGTLIRGMKRLPVRW